MSERDHSGHRVRLKKRFLEHGLDNFADYNVVELLLFFGIPQGDVEGVARDLMERFGTVAAVFDAPISELKKVKGVGEHVAILIKLIPQLTRRYLISRAGDNNVLDSSGRAGRYLAPYFHGERDEVVYMACLDAKCKVINCKLLFRGSVNSAGINVRKIVENALAYNSTSVILAHNHTSGVALPSQEDKDTTRKVREALLSVEIILADHIIVADGDFVSMADNGFLR